MKQKNCPSYKHRHIASIKSLSHCLGVPSAELLEVAKIADSLYRQNTPEPKKNGGVRITYSLEKRLKDIQKSINKNIFGHVHFPSYLQGSIKDAENPRDYIRNANIHAGARLLITEDISDFFPSISAQEVRKIWSFLFNFSDDVSAVLTALTTYQGKVAQGGPTSSYIANLIFWDKEPHLVEYFESRGFRYSRYVDDIGVSTQRRFISNKEKSKHVSAIFGMLLSKGVRPNRRKHKIFDSSKKMLVNNLVVNAKQPTIGKTKKKNLRLELFNLKKLSQEIDPNSEHYRHAYDSLMGKINTQLQLHPESSKKIKSQLLELKPALRSECSLEK